MLARGFTAALAVAVVGAVSIQLFAPGSGLIAIVAGLCLVVGGTFLTARLSHSQPALLALKSALATFWRNRHAHDGQPVDLKWFLQAATYFRYGNIRPAEDATSRIAAPFLRRGTQMVLDGFPREQVALALQRQIAEERDQARHPVELLRAMAGYSPTLGMLGTLLGLVQMLFGLGSGDVERIGSSMGFAMLTTVYGLVLANLFFKPLASKLEQIGRRATAQSAAQMQAVMMLFDRPHAEIIREVMDEMGPRSAPAAAQPAFSFAASR